MKKEINSIKAVSDKQIWGDGEQMIIQNSNNAIPDFYNKHDHYRIERN